MEIRIDPQADALYLTLKRGRVARTREEQDGVMVDLNARGEVLGIEMLDISKNIVAAMYERLARHTPVPRRHVAVRQRVKRVAH